MKAPIDMLFDGVQWVEVPPGPVDLVHPYVTHDGTLELPGFGSMRVYRLSNGMAVINGDDMEAIFGGPDAPEAVRKLLDDNRVQFHSQYSSQGEKK